MITQEQIPAVLGHPVYDREGSKIGEAKHIFLDDYTGQPDWVTVRTGLFGTNESFVPIHEARLVEDHLEVPFPKDQVKEAPNVDVDAGGHLSAREEQSLYQHYGLQQQAATGQARRGEPLPGRPDTHDTGTPGDDAMTRSEEEMRVGVERRRTGRFRLRKYVVTEEVQKTVPVRHEEVRIEREPITDENRESAMSGTDITEAEHEVTLHEERPVVETEVVPKERVRLGVEERTEQETVGGEVRKEEITAEREDEDESRGRGRHRRT